MARASIPDEDYQQLKKTIIAELTKQLGSEEELLNKMKQLLKVLFKGLPCEIHNHYDFFTLLEKNKFISKDNLCFLNPWISSNNWFSARALILRYEFCNNLSEIPKNYFAMNASVSPFSKPEIDVHEEFLKKLNITDDGESITVIERGKQNGRNEDKENRSIEGKKLKRPNSQEDKPIEKGKENKGTGAEKLRKDFEKIVPQIGFDWIKIARSIGMGDYISSIMNDYYLYGLEEFAKQLMIKWQQEKGKDATRINLCKALRDSDRKDLAEEMEAMEDME